MTDQFDNIDAYLNNKLSEDDKKKFEQEMSEDSSLLEAVQQQKDAIRVLELIGDNQLKLQIKTAIKDSKHKTSSLRKLRISWRAITGIAASFLVLALALWFIFSKPSNEALFVSNYEVYNLNETSRNNDTNQDLLAVVDLYQKAQFEEALPLLDKIYQSNKDSKWLLAQAVSLIETQQYQEAIDKLSMIRSKDTDVYQNPALWYTAMAYLKLDQREQAIETIQSLSEKEADLYTKKAKDFLEAI